MLGAMDWPRLDARAWNLSLGALATTVMAGCGPFVIPTGETDTDSATDTNPTSPNPTDPDATDTTPPQCHSASDCQPGEECIDNVCIPYDPYCDTGYCCYDCCYGECYYSECYSDADCGPMGLCEASYYAYYQSCQYPSPLPECASAPPLAQLDLPLAAEGEVVSLAFVDVNGDAAADLLVGRNGSAHVHVGPNGAFPLALPLPPGLVVIDAASGDLDGDGDADIVVSTAQGNLLVISNGGPLGFQLETDVSLGLPLRELATLEWNGDGTVDVAGVQEGGQAMVLLGSGDGGFIDIVGLSSFGVPRSLALANFDGNQFGDIVLQDDMDFVQVFLGATNTEPDYFLGGLQHGERRVVAGQLSFGIPDEVIGYTAMSGGWQLLELWPDGVSQRQLFSLPGDATWAELGDLDGDSALDLILGGGMFVQYVYTSPAPWFSCYVPLSFGAAVSHLAVGDFDGNGRADVAFSSGQGVSVMMTP
jgi:hypothetical protein